MAAASAARTAARSGEWMAEMMALQRVEKKADWKDNHLAALKAVKRADLMAL